MVLPILAQAAADVGNSWGMWVGAGLGAGGALIGAGIGVAGAGRGIGNIGGNACEAIARQPEAGGRIGTNMIISAALIEGFTFFLLVIAFLALGHFPTAH